MYFIILTCHGPLNVNLFSVTKSGKKKNVLMPQINLVLQIVLIIFFFWLNLSVCPAGYLLGIIVHYFVCHCPLNHDIVSLVSRPSSAMTASVGVLVCRGKKGLEPPF